MTSPTDIRNMTDSEVVQAIEDIKRELFNLRFQKASGQLENSSRLKVLRRDIARLKTIHREKQIAAELLMKEGHNAE